MSFLKNKFILSLIIILLIIFFHIILILSPIEKIIFIVLKPFQSLTFSTGNNISLKLSEISTRKNLIEDNKKLKEKLNYLDIGSGGESPLPTYFLKNTNWNITVVDKFEWVQKQKIFAEKIIGKDSQKRFNVIEDDFIKNELPVKSFDIITNISVIEHFEKDTDLLAMEKSGNLLKQGGIYLLTTPVNEGYYKEIYVDNDVYGEKAINKKVFYQRHYDLKTIEDRILKPSGLKEVRRIFFGDYGKNFFERNLVFPKILKPLKLFYTMNIGKYAEKYLRYHNKPVSRADMRINTASGIILEMTK